jgi:hypothetical protein
MVPIMMMLVFSPSKAFDYSVTWLWRVRKSSIWSEIQAEHLLLTPIVLELVSTLKSLGSGFPDLDAIVSMDKAIMAPLYSLLHLHLVDYFNPCVDKFVLFLLYVGIGFILSTIVVNF